MKQVIAWRRVSTKKQENSGLGLDAQKFLIEGHAESNNFEIIADYCETYTGTKLEYCKELWRAIEHCKQTGAMLIIAKVDRFRDAHEALGIYKMLDGNIYFCDMPTQSKLMLSIMFSVYEQEARNISIRTKAALDAKKRREGSWAKEYGKNTGTTRADAWKRALEKSNQTNKEKAKLNDNNVRFEMWLHLYESKNGPIDRHTNLDPILEEVIALGYKTSSGKDFNKESLRQMIYRTRQRKLQK